MYCDKDNVNQLTAQLINAGIKDIVVCPGSRNAVLIHNFHEVSTHKGSFRLHPVTDERCAAFYAIGIWVATRCPVAVCITSGSALLNTLPAVAEAYYRQIPLVIISADRPPQWIGQLDGQTLPQYGALHPYAESIQMDEHPGNVSVPVYNPLIPLHINVPISEPLFSFTTEELPVPEYSYFEQWPEIDNGIQDLEHIVSLINEAQLPAVVIGQYEGEAIPDLIKLDEENKLLLLPEIISNHPGAERTSWIESLRAESIEMPDVVIHIGGALVNKYLKLKLREKDNLKVIRVDTTDDLPDTFSHLEVKVKYNEAKFFKIIYPLLRQNSNIKRFKEHIEYSKKHTSTKDKAMAELWTLLRGKDCNSEVLFLGNSTAVRAASRTMQSGIFPMYCNRGVNGIEGSLSVAAGCSAVSKKNVYVVVGDLSFFYDSNALWNNNLKGNLRIILLNDHRGGIFSSLPGLGDSPAINELVAAQHNANAQGIAQSYDCNYAKASSFAEYQTALATMFSYNNNKPYILEYDTSLEQD